jgi:hypothetical protein
MIESLTPPPYPGNESLDKRVKDFIQYLKDRIALKKRGVSLGGLTQPVTPKVDLRKDLYGFRADQKNKAVVQILPQHK